MSDPIVRLAWEIERRRVRPSWGSASEPLLAEADARAVVQLAFAEGIRLLGVEGFYLEPDGIRPLEEAIADFSDRAATLALVARYFDSVRVAGRTAPVVFTLVFDAHSP